MQNRTGSERRDRPYRARIDEHKKTLDVVVADVFGSSGVSARRILKALAKGETNPAVLAAMADRKLIEPSRLEWEL
jgi:hypothetical protein